MPLSTKASEIGATSTLVRRLGWLTLASVFSITMLLSFGQVTLQIMIAQQAGAAQQINIAGRQRLLSQRLVTDILLSLDIEPTTVTQSKQDLRLVIQEWSATQYGLQQGDNRRSLSAPQTTEEVTLLKDMKPSFQALLSIADAQLQHPLDAFSSSTDKAALITVLLSHEQHYLPLMNKLVTVYQDEAEKAQTLFKIVMALLCGFSVLVLFLESFCIFRPALRRLSQAIHELQTTHDQLSSQATRDSLTGLPNHRSMVARLDHELKRVERTGRVCSALFLDIDHFKACNDGYGHAAGDLVLKAFAEVAGRVLRATDTLGRWGGEEFVALLPETGTEDAYQVAERIRSEVATYIFPIGGGMHLTCSIGLATLSENIQSRDALVSAADNAMYAAKRLGRNQVRTADDPALVALSQETIVKGSREDIALQGMVEALAGLVEARLHGMGLRIKEGVALIGEMAQVCGLDAAAVRMLQLAWRLRDIGMVAVSDGVLQGTNRPNDEEWRVIKRHPVIGAEVVGSVPSLVWLAPIIRAHHERWNGKGYPDQLSGEDIPLNARLLSVVDAYLAMTTDRPHQRARTQEEAVQEITKQAGQQFDPEMVRLFLHLLEKQQQFVHS